MKAWWLSSCASGTGVAPAAVTTAAPEPPTVSNVATRRPDPESRPVMRFGMEIISAKFPLMFCFDAARRGQIITK